MENAQRKPQRTETILLIAQKARAAVPKRASKVRNQPPTRGYPSDVIHGMGVGTRVGVGGISVAVGDKTGTTTVTITLSVDALNCSTGELTPCSLTPLISPLPGLSITNVACANPSFVGPSPCRRIPPLSS